MVTDGQPLMGLSSPEWSIFELEIFLAHLVSSWPWPLTFWF